MTKFWMMVVAILALGFTTGCPDGDDCASDPSLCDPDSDTDSDAGADSDTDVTEDDADTSEDTVCSACPDVAGDWNATFRNDETMYFDTYVLTLEQNDDRTHVIGYTEYCTLTGTISESGELSLSGECIPVGVRTVTGTLTSSSRLDGSWHQDGTSSYGGTFWADRQ